jgi:hypothetical protein
LWNHELKFALASAGYQVNLSNLLVGYQARRKVDMSVFLGPSLMIPIDDKAVISSDERVMEGHQVELVEPFTKGGIAFGGHIGVKLRIALSSRFSVIAEPTAYFLGNTKLPCIDFLGVKYMQTVNAGLQVEF